MRVWVLVFLLFLLGCANAPVPRTPFAPAAVYNEVILTRAVAFGGARYSKLRVELSGGEHLRVGEIVRELRVIHGIVDPEVLAYDRLVVSGAYFDRGRVKAQVSDVVTVHGDEVVVTFIVKEGPAFRIGALDIYEDVDGTHVAPLGWSNAVRAGQTFSRVALVEALSALRRAYRDLGYAYVEADAVTSIEGTTIGIRIPVVRGVVATFEHIDISGNLKVPRAMIERELLVQVGDRFSETKLERSRRNLLESAWFVDVAFSTVQGTDPSRIRLSVEVRERASTSYGPVASLALNE